jgi:hypothetical protein
MRERATPIAGLPALLQLAPVDHLWHLIVHVGAGHKDRTGAIRDQLLIRYTASRCTHADLAEVRRRISERGDAQLLTNVMRRS